MIRRFRRWWSDNSTLFFAQGLIGLLRGFFRVRETFAPPEKQAKLRQFREQMEGMEREKNELLRELDNANDSGKSDRIGDALDKLHEFGQKHGGPHDDAEWQAQRARMRTRRAENDALIAINKSAGEDNLQAIAAFQAYINANPDSDSAYSWLAGRLTKNRDYDAAITAYETAIRLHPGDHTRYVMVMTAKNSIAEVQFLKGNTSAAIQAFQAAIDSVPEHNSTLKSIPYLGLGNLYEKIGKIAEAKAAWKKRLHRMIWVPSRRKHRNN